jgi:hypothetical protein
VADMHKQSFDDFGMVHDSKELDERCEEHDHEDGGRSLSSKEKSFLSKDDDKTIENVGSCGNCRKLSQNLEILFIFWNFCRIFSVF